MDHSSNTYVPRSYSGSHALPQCDATLVVIGPPGDGKSTLGNLLARAPDAGCSPAPFRASEDFNSVGTEVAYADFEYQGERHRIVDTTGLFEGAANATDRLAGCARLSPSGIDAFVFVIRKGRFTEEYFDQLRSFEEAAGAGALRRTVIVFSHCGRESNDQLLSRCRKSGNAHLREALQRTAGIVGVDCLTPSRVVADRAAVLAATTRVRQEHRDVPKLAPMDPAELRRQLADMDCAIGGLSSERQDMMKVKMDGVRSGCASLAAVRQALTEARAQQQAEDGRLQEMSALEGSVEAAKREANDFRQAADSIARGGSRSASGAFGCCAPVAAGACEPCDVGVKEVIKEWQQDRQHNIRSKFAEADMIADMLNQQRRV